MRIWNLLVRRALLASALVGGIVELAALQRWRARDWLLGHLCGRHDFGIPDHHAAGK